MSRIKTALSVKRLLSIHLLGIIFMTGLPDRGYAQIQVSGMLYYTNSQQTPLDWTRLYLENTVGQALDSAFTHSSGLYTFNDVPAGEYFIRPVCQKPWGGGNSVDALLILKHFSGLEMLNGLGAQAADVDHSGSINTTDAMQVVQRFVKMLAGFQSGDWLFEQETLVVTGAGNVTHPIAGLCFGDVNGSHVPGPSPAIVTPCPGLPSFVYGGQTYHTVQIGTQCWMQENLNIGEMLIDTDSVNSYTLSSNNGIIEKYCYNNDPANCAIYGGLYDWDEMMEYSTAAGTQGICPAGWHVPSKPEYNILVDYLLGDTVAGNKVKESGTLHWLPGNTATNESGFTALGSGLRSSYGGMGGLKQVAYLWTSSEESGTEAWMKALDYLEQYLWQGYILKHMGFAVRCTRDGN